MNVKNEGFSFSSLNISLLSCKTIAGKRGRYLFVEDFLSLDSVFVKFSIKHFTSV